MFAVLICPIKRDANITGIVNPYAYLSMEIAQVTDSLEVITQINPLEIAEIFGNIGGFWGEWTSKPGHACEKLTCTR